MLTGQLILYKFSKTMARVVVMQPRPRLWQNAEAPEVMSRLLRICNRGLERASRPSTCEIVPFERYERGVGDQNTKTGSIFYGLMISLDTERRTYTRNKKTQRQG